MIRKVYAIYTNYGAPSNSPVARFAKEIDAKRACEVVGKKSNYYKIEEEEIEILESVEDFKNLIETPIYCKQNSSDGRQRRVAIFFDGKGCKSVIQTLYSDKWIKGF